MIYKKNFQTRDSCRTCLTLSTDMLRMLLCKEDFVDFSNVVLGAGVGMDKLAP